MKALKIVVKVIEMKDDKPGREHALGFVFEEGKSMLGFYSGIEALMKSATDKARELGFLP